MNKANHVPYDWETIEGQVREAILCQLSILQAFGPDSPELAQHYLGIDPDRLEIDSEDETEEDQAAVPKSIPLDRHHLHYLARNAYTYAYQLDGWEQASSEDHYEVCGAMAGFPQSDMHGNFSPLASENDAPLRRVFDTFVARWQLYNDDYSSGLSVRELALLSNMTVPAVRTSLSKEGFKLDATARSEPGRRDDDKAATLNNDDALIWLSRRRGFVPNRVARPQPSNAVIAEIFDAADLTFDQALRKALSALQMDTTAFADMISSSQEWVDKLASGEAADIDIPALRKSARALAVPEPEFVARAVHHLIDCDMAHIIKGPP